MMGQVSESARHSSVDDILPWISRECDAVWTAKLVILRVKDLDAIAHFGACLREHERHAEELAQLLPATIRVHAQANSREPRFVTHEPHLIGSLTSSHDLLGAMEAIEMARIAHYPPRRRWVDLRSRRTLQWLLERHACDAGGRLDWLRRRRLERECQCAAAESPTIHIKD
jgi:hypothetical protein